MKKITPKTLSNRLAQYSALSIAIAGVADAHGQVGYTDVDPDLNVVGGVYLLDMDNDGTEEYTINQTANNIFIAGNPSADILGWSSSSNYIYPLALSNGAIISNSATTWFPPNGFYQTMNYNSCYASATNPPGNSNWCGVTDKYLGLRFKIGVDTHYGWARLDAAFTPNVGGFTIKDYYYNPNAGQSIQAGMTLGVNDNELSKIRIVSLNKSIALYNLPQNISYKLFSLTGQSVLNDEINDNTYVIEAKSLASGVYIIEISDLKTNAIIRKKIVL